MPVIFVFKTLIIVFSGNESGIRIPAAYQFLKNACINKRILTAIQFVTVPFIFGSRTNSGFMRVIQNIAENGKQITFAFYRFTDISSLEYMTDPVVFMIEVARVTDSQFLHEKG